VLSGDVEVGVVVGRRRRRRRRALDSYGIYSQSLHMEVRMVLGSFVLE